MRTCDCRMCRRGIRLLIESAWVEHPRWMGVFTVRYEGRLGCCPWGLYREAFGEMVRRGILIASKGDEYPVYMLARLTLRKGGAR
jgi:hypothetical protein